MARPFRAQNFLFILGTQRVALGWYGNAPSGQQNTLLPLLRQSLVKKGRLTKQVWAGFFGIAIIDPSEKWFQMIDFL